jgi:hypothetical protein
VDEKWLWTREEIVVDMDKKSRRFVDLEHNPESDTVAHTCNPSYFGGRDWENNSSRPVWAKD